MSEPELPDPRRPPQNVRPEFQFLDYRGRPDAGAKPPITGTQIATGFGCWVGSVAIAGGLCFGTQSAPVGLIAFVLVTPLAIGYLGGRVGWRGFIPGLLLGAAFTCLVPIGILWVACANSR
jgi:hypothetical protein